MVDPLANLTRFDDSGRSLPVRVTDARGGVTSLAYDANGNLTALTDANGGDPVTSITIWR